MKIRHKRELIQLQKLGRHHHHHHHHERTERDEESLKGGLQENQRCQYQIWLEICRVFQERMVPNSEPIQYITTRR